MSVRLKVFISSGMTELREERRAVQNALRTLEVEPWLFEEDAGAQTIEGRTIYRNELQESDLYIGLFWRQYGQYTINEYELAVASGKDCLIFEKFVDLEDRDVRLTGLLDRIGDVESGHTIKRFTSLDELGVEVRKAVAMWQTGKIRLQRHRAIPPLLAYRCDRSDQISLVQGEAQAVWTARDTRNVVCIVHGNRSECHRELVDVLARYSLPAAGAERGLKPVRDIPVSWPERASDSQQFSKQLTSRISERSLKRVSDVETTAAELDGHHGPVLIHTYVEPGDLRPSPGNAIRRFVQFWNDWPRRTAGEPLFSFLCIRYAGARRTGLLSRFVRGADARLVATLRSLLDERGLIEEWEKAFPNTRVLIARELPDVRLEDAELWADLDDVSDFVGGRAIDVRKRIRRLYESPQFVNEANRISMDPLAGQLETILQDIRT